MRTREISIRAKWAVLATAFLGAILLGCSSDGVEVASSTTSPPPAPGTVTLDVSGVIEAESLVMLSLIGKNKPTQALGAVCAVVETDPFSFAGKYVPITGDDPCTVGTVPIVFEPGSYKVVVAVMAGGARSPEQCREADVTVDGDVTIEVSSLGPPTECDF